MRVEQSGGSFYGISQGDSAENPKSESYEPSRLSREFLRRGGEVREARIPEDLPDVLKLYLHPSTIEHLADVTPSTSVEDLENYYKTHPDSKLIVSNFPDEGIVGALTISKTEGVREIKLNRAVVKEGFRGQGVFYGMTRRSLALGFSSEPQGYGAEQVMIGVIMDVRGFQRPIRAFERFGFDFHGPRLANRCDSWSNPQQKPIKRDVRQMLLQRNTYEMKYGRDLIKQSP